MLHDGDQIGPYRVLGIVGGSSGRERLRAVDEDGTHVALKVLGAPPRDGADPHGAAGVLAELRHPGLVPLLHAGRSQDLCWWAYEWVDAADVVDSVRRSGPLPPGEVATILRPVAGALAAAHQAGIVHGNLKPSKILLPAGGAARLSGFGPSSMAYAARDLATSGMFVGTLEYAAPEQLAGEPVEEAADQYALACIAAFLLVGRSPYAAATQAAVITGHLAGDPPSLVDAGADIAPAVDEVVRRALSRHPQERFAGVTAFVAALESAARGTSPGVAEPVLEIVVVGGPASGTRSPVPDGDVLVGRGDACDLVLPDAFLSRTHLRVHVHGDTVEISDAGSANGTFLDGRRVEGTRPLTASGLVEVGASLLTVRTPSAAPAGDDPDVAAAMDGALARGARPVLRRPGEPAFLRWRIGFDTAAAPLTVDLRTAGSVLVRGASTRCAALVRSLLVQGAAMRSPDDLRLVMALRPTLEDLWSWAGLLPHARAASAPLGGTHVATDLTTARGLSDRLAMLVQRRRSATRDVRDGRPDPFLPYVVAFLDPELLPAGSTDEILAFGPRVQVHPVVLLGADATVPEPVGAVVDIAEPGGDITVCYGDGMTVVAAGTADGVPAPVARSFADQLAMRYPPESAR